MTEIAGRLAAIKHGLQSFFSSLTRTHSQSGKKPKKDKGEGTVFAFSHASFNVLGGLVDPIAHHFEDMRPKLQKAGLKISLRAYVSFLVFFSLLGFLMPLSVSLMLAMLLKVAFGGILLIGCSIGLLGGVITFATTYSYPSVKAGSRGREIDLDLPYVISHMSVLAAAGIPPERIFRSLIMSEKGVLITMFRDIIRDVDFLGKDIISALEATADRSPSKEFSEVCEGMIATVISGGEIGNYLHDKAKSLMELKRIKAKTLGDLLSIVGESYVTMLVVFPLVLIIMFTVMASVSSSIGGMSILLFMHLVAYALVPLMSLAVLVLLDTLIPKG